MISGEKWMLMWRSGGSWPCSSEVTGLVSRFVRVIVLAVGRLRPPYADDVQHYQRLIAGLARLELIEVREDEHVVRRIPDRAFVSVLDADGEAMDSIAFSRFLEKRRQDGRDLCFVIGGPLWGPAAPRRVAHRLSPRPDKQPHPLPRGVLLGPPFRAPQNPPPGPAHYLHRP